MTQAHAKQRSGISAYVSLAWIITLLVSLLPDILFKEVTGSLPAWLFWTKLGLIGSFLIASLFWKYLHPLRLFFAVLAVIYLLEWGVNQFYQSISYTSWFVGAGAFTREIGAVQIPRLTVGILIVLIMLVLVHRFENFYLVKGKLDAEAAPIPLIMTRPSSWRILGPAIAGAMCLGLLVFRFAFGSLPSMVSFKGIIPLVPVILLFSANNAFGEEMLYRAPWLSALEKPLGAPQALLITATYFGIGHFYGVPYGIVGVIMAFIPGWLMGKAMLETRGFFWAWFIHFCMDMVIFSMIALGSITPGG
jgi:membrane protease YdiL (CAAX protease family)